MNALGGKNIRIIDDTSLECSFRRPRTLPDGQKRAALNAIIDHPFDGVSLLPGAVEVTQDIKEGKVWISVGDAALGVSKLSTEAAAWAGLVWQITGVFTVLAFAPLLLRFVWDTVPLESGELRDRVERVLARNHVKEDMTPRTVALLRFAFLQIGFGGAASAVLAKTSGTLWAVALMAAVFTEVLLVLDLRRGLRSSSTADRLRSS